MSGDETAIKPSPLPKYVAVFRTATKVTHNNVPTLDERLHTHEYETLDRIMQVIKAHADHKAGVNTIVSPLVLYTMATLKPSDIVDAAKAVLARPAQTLDDANMAAAIDGEFDVPRRRTK